MKGAQEKLIKAPYKITDQYGLQRKLIGVNRERAAEVCQRFTKAMLEKMGDQLFARFGMLPPCRPELFLKRVFQLDGDIGPNQMGAVDHESIAKF